MPTSVTMPALGESVTEGTVTRWLKQEGEQVEADEPLLEVSTDKVDTEIPSPAAGVLTKILVAEDETVEVGAELAVIGGGDGGEAPAPAAQEEPADATPEPEPEPAQQETPAQEEAPAPSGDSGGSGGGEGTSVTMPALGESVTEGTVTRWLKSVGDEITADEPLLEVSTDKVDTEIPAPVSGTLLSITVNEDETVDVGAELAVIGTSGSGGGSAPAAQPAATTEPESAPAASETDTSSPAPEAEKAPEPQKAPEPKAAPAEKPAPAPQAPAAQQQAAPAPAAASSGDGSGAYVTPLVRRLAAERGVDLGSVSGSGVGGRIRKQDVLA